MAVITESVRIKARVVAASGAILGAVSTLAPRGLLFRENRIMRGDSVSLLAGLEGWGWLVLGLWVAAGILAFAPLRWRARGAIVTTIGALLPILLVWCSGTVATTYAEATGEIARTSFGWAFWTSLLASYVVIFAATAWLEPGWRRTLLSYLPVLAIGALAMAGHLSELAIAREYASNVGTFWREFRLHLTYVVTTVGIGLVVGLLLGLLAARRRSLEPVVFGALNVLQVLPTLAFIGLLNPILAGLSNRVPLLARLGIRGVGWAPVIIVLTAYAIYPIARNTYTAIVSLDPSVVDAARGVGMGRWRMLAEVELPLALPVIVAGLRVALVQTTAGAIIAGLVGGGGLGTFVFLGSGQVATDLILLGVLPIVALGLFFDRSALALQTALGSWGERV